MKFEKTWTGNWEGALRGMRFAMKSNDKADSVVSQNYMGGIPLIGPNDMKLCRSLIKASQGGRPATEEEYINSEIGKSDGNNAHRKFLRQILVSVDINAPLYFWSEFDTYKVGTTANSESTMHTLLKDDITLDNFVVDTYGNDDDGYVSAVHLVDTFIEGVKELKEDEIATDLEKLRMLKQSLPTSWLQRRHVTMNYEVVRNMYHQRKNHRLTEWNTVFVEWVKSLPYAEELIIG